MRRREFIVVLSGATAAWSLSVRAQQKSTPVIGFLSIYGQPPNSDVPILAEFRKGLSETGFIEGRNVAIEYRWAERRYDRLPALAADLVVHKVDLIVASGAGLAAQAAKDASPTTPIVFGPVPDPVGSGLVASLARPGGNLTGFSNISGDLMRKQLELLSEMVPHAKVIALIVNPSSPDMTSVTLDLQSAALAKGLQLQLLEAATEEEIDTAFAGLVKQHVGALLIQANILFGGRLGQIATLASHNTIPAIYTYRAFADAGGLISYGPSLPAMYHDIGVYAGRILNGAKPADLPVQQPARFELVINLQTAKALGLTVPQSLLARADEVLE